MELFFKFYFWVVYWWYIPIQLTFLGETWNFAELFYYHLFCFVRSLEIRFQSPSVYCCCYCCLFSNFPEFILTSLFPLSHVATEVSPQLTYSSASDWTGISSNASSQKSFPAFAKGLCMYVCLSGYTVITHSLDSRSVRAQRFSTSQVFLGLSTVLNMHVAFQVPGQMSGFFKVPYGHLIA